MSETMRQAGLRYRVGGHAVAARVLLDLQPDSEIAEADWPVMRAAIMETKVSRFADINPEGTRIAIELRLHASYRTMTGVLGAAHRICQTLGIERVGKPKAI